MKMLFKSKDTKKINKFFEMTGVGHLFAINAFFDLDEENQFKENDFTNQAMLLLNPNSEENKQCILAVAYMISSAYLVKDDPKLFEKFNKEYGRLYQSNSPYFNSFKERLDKEKELLDESDSTDTEIYLELIDKHFGYWFGDLMSYLKSKETNLPPLNFTDDFLETVGDIILEFIKSACYPCLVNEM